MSAITVVVGLLSGMPIDSFSAVRLLPVFLVPLTLSKHRRSEHFAGTYRDHRRLNLQGLALTPEW